MNESQHAEPAPQFSDLGAFTSWLRSSELGFIPCNGTSPGTCYLKCYDALYSIGRDCSISHGVAAAMHLYMLAAIANFPLESGELRTRRDAFIAEAHKNRLLIANSGIDDSSKLSGSIHSPATAEFVGNGILVNGTKTFVSMAAFADLIVFTAQERSSSAQISLYAPLRAAEVAIGDPVFGTLLGGAGTRSVSFCNLHLGHANIVARGTELLSIGHLYQRTWFQGLISAVYLGALSQALDHLARFSVNLRIATHQSLAGLDGFIADCGKLRIELITAIQLRDSLILAFDKASQQPSTAAFAHAAEVASVIKNFGTRTAERAASTIRTLMGTRSMKGQSTLTTRSGPTRLDSFRGVYKCNPGELRVIHGGARAAPLTHAAARRGG